MTSVSSLWDFSDQLSILSRKVWRHLHSPLSISLPQFPLAALFHLLLCQYDTTPPKKLLDLERFLLESAFIKLILLNEIIMNHWCSLSFFIQLNARFWLRQKFNEDICFLKDGALLIQTLTQLRMLSYLAAILIMLNRSYNTRFQHELLRLFLLHQ